MLLAAYDFETKDHFDFPHNSTVDDLLHYSFVCIVGRKIKCDEGALTGIVNVLVIVTVVLSSLKASLLLQEFPSPSCSLPSIFASTHGTEANKKV